MYTSNKCTLLLIIFKNKNKNKNKIQTQPIDKHTNKKLIARVLCPNIILAHVANFGWLPDQDQILAHFRDHLISTVTCNWTLFEERVINTICGQIWLATELWTHFRDHL